MMYKVFFQKDINEVPVREFTQSVFVEAESEADVRKKLAPRNYNIEFITPISGVSLEYEKRSDTFVVESI